MIEERKQFAINKEKIEMDLKKMNPIKSPSHGLLFWEPLTEENGVAVLP